MRLGLKPENSLGLIYHVMPHWVFIVLELPIAYGEYSRPDILPEGINSPNLGLYCRPVDVVRNHVNHLVISTTPS